MSTPTERREIYLTPRWRRLRLAILRAAGGVCQSCGKRAADEVHHKHPIREGGETWNPANLIALCRRCHRAEHDISPIQLARREWRQLAEEHSHAEIR